MRGIISTLILFTLLSCGGGGAGGSGSGEGGKGGSPSAFDIRFTEVKTHSNTQNFSLKGESENTFGAINFFLTSDCSGGTIATVGQILLRNGATFPIPVNNETVEIYYNLTEVPSHGCRFLTTFTHDTILPPAPTSILPSVQALNGLRTRSIPLSIEVDFNSLPEDVYGFRFYGNSNKTIFLGEVTPERNTINLIANSVNNLFYSHIDRAGNESALLNTNVLVTNDSTPPATPTTHLSGTQYTSMTTFELTVAVPFDAIGVSVSGPEGKVFSASTTLTLNLSLNTENNFEIRSVDDVGNESVPLLVRVVHDNIAPEKPILSADSQAKISLPVSGPTNSLDFNVSEEGLLRVVNGPLEDVFEVTPGVNTVELTFFPENGTNNLSVFMVDRAGNASLPLNLSFLVDSIAPSTFTPSIALIEKVGGYINASHLKITGDAPDAVTLVITTNSRTSAHLISELASGIDIEMDRNVVNNISIKSLDLAGNESTPYNFSLTHDDIAPVVAITYPVNGKAIREGGVIQGTCESRQITAVINGNSSTADCIDGEFTVALSNGLPDGLSIKATFSETDLAGNTGTFISNFSIDNTPPFLSIYPEFLVGVTNNPNFIISGECELGGTVYLTGDSSGASSCLMGSYALSLNNSVEGTRNFTLSITDYAGNTNSLSFSKDFDFTPPPAVILSEETTRHHQTALQASQLMIKGTLAEDVSVIVARNSSLTDIVAEKTRAELIDGFNVPLLEDRDNTFYIFAQDLAGNKSPLSYVLIHQRNSLSKKYLVDTAGINYERPLGELVQYSFVVSMKNSSYDTNINKRIMLDPYTFATSDSDVVIDEVRSTCDGSAIYNNDSCEFYINVNFSRSGTDKSILERNRYIRVTYNDGQFQDIPLNFTSAPVTPTTITASGMLKAPFFSETAIEGWQREVIDHNNIYLHQNLNYTSSDKKKRFQAKSTYRIYKICEDLPERVCVSTHLSPNMPETYFNNVLLPTSLTGETLTATSSLTAKIQILAEDSERDYIYIGYNNPTTNTAMNSHVVSYHRASKTYTTFTLSPFTGLKPALVDPMTGWYRIVNNSILMNLVGNNSEAGIYSFDLLTGSLTRVSESNPLAGSFLVGNYFYFTHVSGELRRINTSTLSVTTVEPENFSTTDRYICQKGFHNRDGFRNVDDLTNYARQFQHALVPLCSTLTNNVEMIGYMSANGYDAVVASGNVKIEALQVVDANRLIATVANGTSFTHFYRNNLTSITATKTDSTVYFAGYSPRIYIVKGKILGQEGRNIFELDEALETVKTVESFGYDIRTFKATGTFGVISTSATPTISYYDDYFDKFNFYQNLSPYSTHSGFSILNGFLYFYGSSSTQVGMMPLYFK